MTRYFYLEEVNTVYRWRDEDGLWFFHWLSPRFRKESAFSLWSWFPTSEPFSADYDEMVKEQEWVDYEVSLEELWEIIASELLVFA